MDSLLAPCPSGPSLVRIYVRNTTAVYVQPPGHTGIHRRSLRPWACVIDLHPVCPSCKRQRLLACPAAFWPIDPSRYCAQVHVAQHRDSPNLTWLHSRPWRSTQLADTQILRMYPR
ncbi:uncharacterized protein UDID_18074 [Ustilago sp. UG-2017a]|nr:uncharacterized protein UDID_18074 [Ustilago sp. UG-2017a]